MTTSLEYAYFSSSAIKQIASFDGDITPCVPDFVADLIYDKYRHEKAFRAIACVNKESFMSSRIEQLIDEIEEYIESCKPKFMSSTEIIVNKDEIDELLRELRMKTPDEIKRYQKIISNKRPF